MSYNLAIVFPTPTTFSDAEVMRYAEPQIMLARSITGRRRIVLYTLTFLLASGELVGGILLGKTLFESYLHGTRIESK